MLTYLHGQTPAVIHRDIKPENIIRTSEKDIRLIDFGIARTFREDTDTDTQVIGTKPYMAPEQFGSEQSDNRADIYALGMVMLFLATGKPDRLLLKTAYPYKSADPRH
ncbi:MAG: serine/threonine protein kinase [Christensenellales bacterium]